VGAGRGSCAAAAGAGDASLSAAPPRLLAAHVLTHWHPDHSGASRRCRFFKDPVLNPRPKPLMNLAGLGRRVPAHLQPLRRAVVGGERRRRPGSRHLSDGGGSPRWCCAVVGANPKRSRRTCGPRYGLQSVGRNSAGGANLTRNREPDSRLSSSLCTKVGPRWSPLHRLPYRLWSGPVYPVARQLRDGDALLDTGFEVVATVSISTRFRLQWHMC
jgi:hypothetical protein